MLAAQRAYNESSGGIDPFRHADADRIRGSGVVEGDDLVPEAEFLQTPLYTALFCGRSDCAT